MHEDASGLGHDAVYLGVQRGHATIAIVDVLRRNGVELARAANSATSRATTKPRFRDSCRRVRATMGSASYLTDSHPSHLDIYGRGRIREAARGCRRNLDVRGLNAFHRRTFIA